MASLLRRRAAMAGAACACALQTRRAASERREGRSRVLITGFHDWRDVGSNVWRCRDNPSCRLLLGPPCASPPIMRDGPLVHELKKTSPRACIHYVTLPVGWGAASGLDLSGYDVVVHIGLGVYEGHTTLLLEKGAYNERRGTDASNHAPPEHTIESGAPQELYSRTMTSNYDALEGTELPGGFELKLVGARPQNAFLCNETHYRALKAVDAHASSLTYPGPEAITHGPKAVYFLHIPYARGGSEDNHVELATAVAALITRMVRLQEEANAR